VSCECCFTVVHDVLVACISIYQGGEKNQSTLITYSSTLYACHLCSLLIWDVDC
jgi:hypothetical protein